MTITLFCKCGKRMYASEEAIGSQVNCPACHEKIVVPGEPAEPSKQPAAYAQRASLLKFGLLLAAACCFSLYIVWLFIPLVGLRPYLSVGILGTPMDVESGSTNFPFYSLGFVGLLLLAQWVLLRPHQSLTILTKEKRGRSLWLAILVAVVVISAQSVALTAFVLLVPLEGNPSDQIVQNWLRMLFCFCLAIGFLWCLWFLVFFIYWKQGHYPMQASGAGHLFGASLTTGFIGMLLCTGFLATLLEIPNWWVDIPSRLGRHSIWIAMLVLWVFWTGVFFLYWRQGDRTTKMGRVVRLLIAGSCLELFIAMPLHAMVYYRLNANGHGGEQCFCERGSYTGLVFGLAVLLWAFGPGVVLLFLREKNRRQELLERLCYRCGAEKFGSEGLERCPRCDFEIPEASR